MLLRRLLFLSLLFATHFVRAENSDETDLQRWFKTDPENAAGPAEEAFQMPALTSLGEWRVYEAGRQMGGNRVEIAVDSISIGKNDRILRYAIAVTSQSGLGNVFFEGLDCFSSRYRSYAWANPDQTWRQTDKAVWRVSRQGTRNTWQASMIDDFCGDAGPYDLKTITDSLKKGELPPRQRAEHRR